MTREWINDCFWGNYSCKVLILKIDAHPRGLKKALVNANSMLHLLAGLYWSCDLWGTGEVKKKRDEVCSPDISSADDSKVLLIQFLHEICPRQRWNISFTPSVWGPSGRQRGFLKLASDGIFVHYQNHPSGRACSEWSLLHQQSEIPTNRSDHISVEPRTWRVDKIIFTVATDEEYVPSFY